MLAETSPPTQPIASSSSQISAFGLSSLGSHSLPIFDFPQALNMMFDRPSVPPPAADIHNISATHIPSGLDELYVALSLSCLSAPPIYIHTLAVRHGLFMHPNMAASSPTRKCKLFSPGTYQL